MGNADPNAPGEAPTPVPATTAGKTRVCVAGYGFSPNFNRAAMIAKSLEKEFPDRYETWFYGPSRSTYINHWLPAKVKTLEEQFQKHKTSPLCWFQYADGKTKVLGGRDRFSEWVIANEPKTSKSVEIASNGPSWFDNYKK